MNAPTTLRLGVYGDDNPASGRYRNYNLWAPGYSAVVTAAGAEPVPLQASRKHSWNDLLDGLDGVVIAERRGLSEQALASEPQLVEACRELRLPVLAVDHGMHVLNVTFGGTLFTDLPRELPNALQHRCRPEPGLRHAINVLEKTTLARIYGEGEIVVNSEHTCAIDRLARGFRVSALALDGVIEAIESETDDWYVMGVQWHPASASASGLDIQLFRGLMEACQSRVKPARRSRSLAA